MEGTRSILGMAGQGIMTSHPVAKKRTAATPTVFERLYPAAKPLIPRTCEQIINNEFPHERRLAVSAMVERHLRQHHIAERQALTRYSREVRVSGIKAVATGAQVVAASSTPNQKFCAEF